MKTKHEKPPDAKLIMGILASNATALEKALMLVGKEFGEIDLKSPAVPFTFTDFYNSEMGGGIIRQYVSFASLIPPDTLCDIKKKTNRMEDDTRADGKRTMNLDPGYLTMCSVVLASTKESSYRVYLRDGIYAQPTLQSKKTGFIPFEFTYPDYADSSTRAFFDEVRSIYRRQLRSMTHPDRRNS